MLRSRSDSVCGARAPNEVTSGSLAGVQSNDLQYNRSAMNFTFTKLRIVSVFVDTVRKVIMILSVYYGGPWMVFYPQYIERWFIYILHIWKWGARILEIPPHITQCSSTTLQHKMIVSLEEFIADMLYFLPFSCGLKICRDLSILLI